MEIRARRYRDAEHRGQGAVVRFGRRAVIAMPGLECRESGVDEPRQVGIDARQPGVRERRDSAGGGDDVDHFRHGRAAARHESRTAGAEQAIEGVAPIDGVAGSNEGIRHRRPANAAARMTRCLGEDRRNVDRALERFEPFADLGALARSGPRAACQGKPPAVDVAGSKK